MEAQAPAPCPSATTASATTTTHASARRVAERIPVPAKHLVGVVGAAGPRSTATDKGADVVDLHKCAGAAERD